MSGPVELTGQTAARSLGQAAHMLVNLAYASRPYHLTLRGPMPDTIVLNPPELRPGHAPTGEHIIDGRFDLPGGHASGPPGVIFIQDTPNATFAEQLHGFGWLRHLAAITSDTRTADARDTAQALAAAWLDQCTRWHPVGWQPHIIARRLIAWSNHGAMLLEGAELIYRSNLLRSMAAQARHLARTASRAPDGLPKLTAAIGLALSGVTLSEGRTRLARGLALLGRELDRQLLPDGGHVSRNPQIQLELLADLVSLRDALMARDVEVPAKLLSAIDRAMPMLRFFRHGDARLALFNGADESPAGAVDAVLAHDDAHGRPFGFAPHSGFQRAAAGRTLVVVDAGAPPKPTCSQQAHAGCLSFEMSAGRHRLVVNCGPSHAHEDSQYAAAWSDAARATAAHSTVTVDDTSSARILQGRWLRALLGPRLTQGPKLVESRRTEEDRGVWLEMRHDGYVQRFGLEHERRVFLSADGDDFRGEDTLFRLRTPPAPWWDPFGIFNRPSEDENFAVRFHLHPDVRVSMAHDGTNILALLPNGDGWQFRASGNADVGLEESIYMGQPGPPRRTQQIVVSHHVFRGEAHVKWSFRRLTTRNLGTNEETSEPEQTDAFAPEEAEPSVPPIGLSTSREGMPDPMPHPMPDAIPRPGPDQD